MGAWAKFKSGTRSLCKGAVKLAIGVGAVSYGYNVVKNVNKAGCDLDVNTLDQDQLRKYRAEKMRDDYTMTGTKELNGLRSEMVSADEFDIRSETSSDAEPDYT